VVDQDLEILRDHPASAGEYVRLRVRDNGLGMTADVQAHLFEPFFTTKEVGKGTGQGLSIAHNVIKAHGGKLEYVTEIGKGTTFTVRLPIVDTASEAEVA